MEARNPFWNISPLDHRYWQANESLFDALSQTLSEQASVRYLVRAEVALLKAHIRNHLENDSQLLSIVSGLEEKITGEEVATEEEKTQHNIRALVNVIQRYVPPKLAPWVHLGATSVDILDTAMAMRVRDAMQQTVIPLVLELLDALVELTRDNADVSQVGRTHGQFAVPITFGFAMAEYVSRIGQSVEHLVDLSFGLCGKLSGAVGAYNATSLLSSEPEVLEEEYLKELGLQKADYANQIVEPEHLLRLLLELNVCFGILANLADDLRHLQRSEIGELSESFKKSQVGSSTMPQKRNPWNSEHVKSLWKAFSPRVITFFMDQISEHQRDLSNSASGRFVTDYIAGFSAATARMRKVIAGLGVHQNRMQENLCSLGDTILAEPTYILLALSNYPDAHEIVRKATLESASQGCSLKEILQLDNSLWNNLSRMLEKIVGTNAEKFYSNPTAYSGLASEKALALAHKYHKISQSLRKKLGV